MFRLMRLLKLVASSAILQLEVMRLKTLIQRPQSSWLWEFDWDVPIPSMCGIFTIIYQHEYHKNHPSRVSKYTYPSHESIYGFFVKNLPLQKREKKNGDLQLAPQELLRFDVFSNLIICCLATADSPRFQPLKKPPGRRWYSLQVLFILELHPTKRVSNVTVSNYGSWKVPLISGGKKPFF